MKAVSIRQLWAWAIIFGGKDIENRRRPKAGHANVKQAAIQCEATTFTRCSVLDLVTANRRKSTWVQFSKL